MIVEADAVVAEAWQERCIEIVDQEFAEIERLKPSEYAEQARILSTGPNAGLPWRNEMTPYLVEILDFIADPWERRGVVRKSARVGFTEGVIGNALMWTVAVDPSPIAIVQPSDKEAASYSKEQIEPLVDHNPELAKRLGETGKRSADASMVFKKFEGGYLTILGSASDKNLRRRSLRRVFADEVDGMKVEGVEGDPLFRLSKRTDDYDDGVLLVGSTPTLKDLSRIDREYERSDQRKWYVPCPHCHEEQWLRFGGPDVEYGIKWERTYSCAGCGEKFGDTPPEECPHCKSRERDTRHLPDTAYYLCEHCGSAIEETEKPAMIRAGHWVAEAPENTMPGWHLNAFMSLFPGARWGKLVGEFLEAKDDTEDLKVWVNQVAGEAWEERTETKVEAKGLEARAVAYVKPDGALVEVPDGVGILTAGVDVQEDRLELLIRGYGSSWRSWDILHERIIGDPRKLDDTWARLDFFLSKTFRHEHGVSLPVLATFVDSGYATDTVYDFVAPRQVRKVYASKGDEGKPGAPPIKRSTRKNASGVKLWTLGTFTLKDDFFSRLAIVRPGPRYLTLRQPDPRLCNGFDREYFAQFEAEKKIPRRVPGERRYTRSYVQKRARNEAIDLQVLADAAFRSLGKAVTGNMPYWVQRASKRVEEEETVAPDANGDEETKETEETGVTKRGRNGGRRRRSSWANGWR